MPSAIFDTSAFAGQRLSLRQRKHIAKHVVHDFNFLACGIQPFFLRFGGAGGGDFRPGGVGGAGGNRPGGGR